MLGYVAKMLQGDTIDHITDRNVLGPTGFCRAYRWCQDNLPTGAWSYMHRAQRQDDTYQMVFVDVLDHAMFALVRPWE